MKPPTWDIMIASMEHRHEKLKRLLDALAPQLGNGVGAIVYRDNGEAYIGVKRQKMLEASKAEYVCACDDDDMVTEDYVERTREALKSRPDFVGWEQLFYNNGVQQKRVFHSLRYDRWYDDGDGYYRGVTHSNPLRRELALLARFDSLTEGPGEDRRWILDLEATGKVKTEVWVDKPVHIHLRSDLDNYNIVHEPVTVHPPKILRKHVRYIDG